MKRLLEFLGGSHAYGLNTPASDEDKRGIFMHTDMTYILGLNRFEHQENIQDGADEKFKEVRHFLCLLRRANSEAIESLFLDDSCLISASPEFALIKAQRENLMDSERLFKCLLGYMQSELRLANGERTGKLGSKRKDAILEFGFSPKNFTQLLRLAWSGAFFFQRGYFPVNVMKEDKAFGGWLLEIKTNPRKYAKVGLNEAAGIAEKALKSSFDSRKFDYKFKDSVANDLLCQIYGPLVVDALRK